MDQNGLTKLIEECGELIQICAKKQAYFDTDNHPDGKGSIKRRMEDEVGDVCAAISFVISEFGLDSQHIMERQTDKLNLYNEWHAQP